ncbi:MAG: carboxypeptidase regulatory-like domain-containing protein [Candidatus Acidiferrales bacterium]
MNVRTGRSAGIILAAWGVMAGIALVGVEARPRPGGAIARPQSQASGVSVDADNLGGVVTSANGPEAGVWVIAETTDFQTKFRKIVVTDEGGRYLIPELPKANYKIWVRGYGLVDSQPVDAKPGQTLALAAVVAPTPADAAQYYPPNYWYSMLQIPPKAAFPMTVPGEGSFLELHTGRTIQTQADYIWGLRRGCEVCHQMGTKATRVVEPEIGTFPTIREGWERKLEVGQGGRLLHTTPALGLSNPTAMALWTTWMEQIAKGALPPVPPRPQGVERNLVLTMWDFATRTAFPHDLISTDKRKPTVNGNGHLYIVDWAEGAVSIIDPVENTDQIARVPLRNEEWRKQFKSGEPDVMPEYPSPYWGKELKQVRLDPVNAGPGMMDSQGRTWFNVQSRLDVPSYCQAGSDNRFAQYYPLKQRRQRNEGVAYYDPKTSQFTVIDTCTGGSHTAFGYDKDETFYMSARGVYGISWVKARVWDETHDPEKSQGWCPAILDYNGDGKITKPWTTADQPPDPKLDRMIPGPTGYIIAVSPTDGSVWFHTTDLIPGRIVRMEVGAHPPETCMAEVYEPPFSVNNQDGYGPQGIDVDSHGVVWVGLTGSGQLASFDRRKCKVKNGPTATGQHCPEGWTLYPVPGPQFKGSNVAADYFYNDWVDRANTLGLGNDVPVVTGTGSDSLIAYLPSAKKWITLRVPYPMGFFTRSLDGRIDDPQAGWKGRGLWSAVESRVVWHTEGGWGTRPYAVHFQLRPDPLAK